MSKVYEENSPKSAHGLLDMICFGKKLILVDVKREQGINYLIFEDQEDGKRYATSMIS